MCRIHYQSDVVAVAECNGLPRIHGSLQTDAVVQEHFLLISFCRVVERFPGLFERLDGDASFGCSAEYQYHSVQWFFIFGTSA